MMFICFPLFVISGNSYVLQKLKVMLAQSCSGSLVAVTWTVCRSYVATICLF